MDKLKIISLLSGRSERELVPVIFSILCSSVSNTFSIEGQVFSWQELKQVGEDLLKKYSMTLADVVK